MLRIVLAQAGPFQTPALDAVLTRLGNAVIVAHVEGSQAILDAVEQHQPDLLAMDLHLADSTEDVIRQAKARQPSLKVVILTAQHDEDLLARLRPIPIDAYIILTNPAKPSFTQREREVLSLLADGRPNRRIAEELCLAPQTVRNCVSKLYHKLRTHSRAEAARLARRYF